MSHRKRLGPVGNLERVPGSQHPVTRFQCCFAGRIEERKRTHRLFQRGSLSGCDRLQLKQRQLPLRVAVYHVSLEHCSV